jgi:hypothetical protein
MGRRGVLVRPGAENPVEKWSKLGFHVPAGNV